MYCSKCGNQLADGSGFCQTCGSPVPAVGPLGAIPAPAGAPGLPSAAAGVGPHWLPAPTRTYAGFWLRLVAHLIDGLIVGTVGIALLIPFAMMSGIGAGIRGLHPENPPDPAMVIALLGSVWILILLFVLAGWLYSAYCESSEWQATPGKKVLNLMVTDLDGNRLSFGRASGRYFAKIVSSLVPLGLAYIMAGFTERKQALHDMIAGCLVLRS